MKLKAPPGVGDPCVAGVAIAAREGVYDVEDEIGVLLVEAFGFVALESADRPRIALPRVGGGRSSPSRRRTPRSTET